MDGNDYFTIPNFESCSTPRRRKKKKSNSRNTRRFSDEQIRSLESIFYSSDSKLDSRKKVQLATELGLQPRQIAIWFQNRRARWKSKQMETDFRCLRANYDNLASQVRILQEEKNSLLSQLQKLSELNQEGPCETRAKPKRLQDELEQSGVTHSNNNYKTDKKWIENGEGDQGLEVLKGRSNDISHTEEQVCQLLSPKGWSESSEKWCDFDSDGGNFFEYQSCSSLHLQGLSFWG